MGLNTEKIEKFILKNYRHNEFYGYQLQKDLAHEGLDIDMTRLYRILNEMKKTDLLTSRWVKSRDGPRRKMYELSEHGKVELNNILLEAIHTVHSFYGDYLHSIGNKIDVFNSILAPLVENLGRVENIGIFFKYYTPLNGYYFKKIRDNFDAQYYCIKPRGTVSEEYPDNVIAITGNYDDIPLRMNHLDCLILVDLPNEDILDKSVAEWSRVLKKGGTLTILTPSVLLKENLDPMTIGEFVEKMEHTIIEKSSVIDQSRLNEALESYFTDIEARQIVHISTVTCNKKNIYARILEKK